MMKRNILIVLGLLLMFGLPGSLVLLQRSQDNRGQAAMVEEQTSTYLFGKAVEITSGRSALVADALLPGSVFTFETWVYLQPFSQSSPETRTVFSQTRKNGTDGMSLVISGSGTQNNGQSGTLALRMQQGGSVVVLPATVGVTVNNWHHLAAVKTANTIKLFLDGFGVGEKSYNGSLRFDARDILSMGATVLDATEPPANQLNGAIDDIRISTIARYDKAEEIPSQPFTADPQTRALWHLNGNTVDTSLNSDGLQFIGSVRFIDSLIGITAVPSPTTAAQSAVKFVSPKKGSSSYRSIMPVVVEVTGTTPEEIIITVDGKLLCTLSAEPYVCNWTVDPSEVPYILEANARDSAGDITSETISVTLQ